MMRTLLATCLRTFTARRAAQPDDVDGGVLDRIFEHNRLRLREGRRTEAQEGTFAELTRALSTPAQAGQLRRWRRFELVTNAGLTIQGECHQVLVLDASAGGFRIAAGPGLIPGTFGTLGITWDGTTYGFVCEVAWSDAKNYQYGLAIGRHQPTATVGDEASALDRVTALRIAVAR